MSEHEVLVFLVQLFLLVAVARILGWMMKSVGQPPVVGSWSPG
jgi:Kef-type K+ transport system membrane component KefB